MANFPTLINGIEYSWSTITITVNGTPVAGATSINYTQTRTKENIYGAGDQPVSRGRGNTEYEGSLTLLKSELEALKNSSPNRNILKIPPFTITVSFVPEGAQPVSEVLKYVEFTEQPFDGSQGDTSFELELPFVYAGQETV
jgi:hypothetical protein